MTLLYEHLCNQAAMSGAGKEVRAYLASLPVYEISNVLGLFDDWTREQRTPIPKRPPHSDMWAEWSDDAGRFNCGCVIARKEASAIAAQIQSQAELLEQFNEIYLVRSYMRANRDGAGQLRAGQIGYWEKSCLACMSDESRGIEFRMVRQGSHPEWGVKELRLRDGEQGSEMMWFASWPPFMAFALLHCKNVSTEAIAGQANPPRLVKRGWPPLKKEHHVLRLDLPGELRPKNVASQEDTDRHMRFHLCRGHFKNLQHERYKSRGWHWWPAHWRGSKALGEVEKTYELHGKGEDE